MDPVVHAVKNRDYGRGLPVVIVRDLKPGDVFIGSKGKGSRAIWFAGSVEAMERVFEELECRVFRARSRAQLTRRP